MSAIGTLRRWLELDAPEFPDLGQYADLRRELAESRKRIAELLEENEAHLERIAELEGQVERLREQPTPAPPPAVSAEVMLRLAEERIERLQGALLEVGAELDDAEAKLRAAREHCARVLRA